MNRKPRMLPLEVLVPAEWNANRVPAGVLAKVRRSIEEFGLVENLVARPHPSSPEVFEVISGNHRLGLLEELGFRSAPVVVVEVDDAHARILAQTLNRTRGADDPEAYARLLDEVLGDVGAERAVEFLPETVSSIDRVLATVRAGIDPALPGDPPQRPQSKLGEVYELGAHRLMCGDATDLQQVGELCGQVRFAAMVTDPPYGIDREGIANDEPEMLSELYAGALAAAPLEDAVCAVFQSPRLVFEWIDAVRGYGHRLERLLWLHRPAAKTFPWRSWVLASDAIVLSSVGLPQWPEPGAFCHDTYVKTELEEAVLTGLHTTIKPARVVADLLSKLPAGPCYEPFAGSGTALMAAEMLGRPCYAMEVDPAYCDVIRDRYERGRVAAAA